MRALRWILGIALLVVLGLTLARSLTSRNKGAFAPVEVGSNEPFPKLWPVTDFSLTDRSGRTVTLADLRGKVWVADLIYTTCPGPCPMITARLSELQSALGEDPEVRLVSVTSDPETDTPQKLQAYAERFHAGPRWYFLTGPKAAIYSLANDGFKLGLAEVADPNEPITHGTKLLLIDRKGIVRSIFDPDAVQPLADAIHRLEKE